MTTKAWWKSATVYQIYPSSFMDRNGDGVGDLPGIESKLDYLKELGVDVLWTSPINPSPDKDMGYDVSDYRDIDQKYGSLADWDSLVEGLHNRGMKFMMDIVSNHTSDQHAWFKAARSSSDQSTNPKRNWYIWRPPRQDSAGNISPPNNWKSLMGGSAWQYDEPTGEYYLHLYMPEQPDLNWDNPEVRKEMCDVMNFWVARGCDGFRMDAINLISKDARFPDAPITIPEEQYQPAGQYFADGPRVHEYLHEINQIVFSKHDLIVVGELSVTHNPEEALKYVNPANRELQTVFQQEFMKLDRPANSSDPFARRQWRVKELSALLVKWQTLKPEDGFWNSVFIENHDNPRSVSRFGNTSTLALRTVTAKLLAILQITQSGTLYLFQGEELGMANFPLSWNIDEYKDGKSLNYFRSVRQHRQDEQGKEDVDMSDVMEVLNKKARDQGRTPMQWDGTENGGFSTGKPRMRVNDDYAEGCNASSEMLSPSSIWSFWKESLAIRKAHDVLIYGDFAPLESSQADLLAYCRTASDSKAVVLLNFSSEPMVHDLDGHLTGMRLLLSNVADHPPSAWSGKINSLQPYEGRVYIVLS